MTEEELSDEQKEDLYERTSIILEEARSQFDRFHSNIDSLNSKIVSLFQIFLVVLTMQLTVFLYYLDNNEIQWISYCIVGCLILVSVVIILISLYLIWPKKYEYPSLFGEKRFYELSEAEKYELTYDFYCHTKKSYDSNQKTYSRLLFGFQINLFLVFVNLILCGALIVTLILDLQ